MKLRLLSWFKHGKGVALLVYTSFWLLHILSPFWPDVLAFFRAKVSWLQHLSLISLFYSSYAVTGSCISRSCRVFSAVSACRNLQCSHPACWKFNAFIPGETWAMQQMWMASFSSSGGPGVVNHIFPLDWVVVLLCMFFQCVTSAMLPLTRNLVFLHHGFKSLQ